MTSFRLVLFVLGDAPRSRRARANLKASLDELGCGEYVPIEEVDLVEDPERGLAHGIISTPAVACIANDGHQQILYGDLGTEATARSLLQRQVAAYTTPSEQSEGRS